MNEKQYVRNTVEYIVIIFNAILLAFNYQFFIVKNGFAPAGLNGIATMVQYKTGFSIGYMTLLINIPLCLLALKLVDKRFAKRTLFFVWFIPLDFFWLKELDLSLFSMMPMDMTPFFQ